jgi:hypothetical protein
MVGNANGMVLASARTVLSPVHPDATTAQSYTQPQLTDLFKLARSLCISPLISFYTGQGSTQKNKIEIFNPRSVHPEDSALRPTSWQPQSSPENATSPTSSISASQSLWPSVRPLPVLCRPYPFSPFPTLPHLSAKMQADKVT